MDFDHLRDDDAIGQGLFVEFGKEQRKDLLLTCNNRINLRDTPIIR